MVSISDTTTSKYWQNLVSMMDKAEENILKKCRTGDTCFASLSNIVGNLLPRHPRNITTFNMHTLLPKYVSKSLSSIYSLETCTTP